MDAIGDYLIARNFFYELKKDSKFKIYKFYIVCLPRLKELVKELDGDFFEEIFVAGPELQNYNSKISFLRSLNRYKFKYLIHPTGSPDPIAHSFVKYSNARYKIGFKDDGINCTIEDKIYYAQFYTTHIAPGNKFGHEFEKQKEFYSKLIQKEIVLSKPYIKIKVQNLSHRSILLCPGAQHPERIWSIENYANLLSLLHKNFPDFSYSILTGPGEESLNELITANISFKVKGIKSPSFNQLISHFAAAELIICNDSSPAHFAVALSKKSVCISNGNNFKRFVPYPEESHSLQVTVVPQALKDPKLVGSNNSFYYGSTLNINEVKVEEVLNACVKQLNHA